MGIPLRYRKSGESSVNYSYNDIADGTGIQLFYGAVTSTKTTNFYILTSNSIYSELLYTSGSGGNADYTQVFNKNFDVLFNVPKTINGTLTSIIPLALNSNSALNTTIRPDVIIQQVSEGIPTTLASISGANYVGPDSTAHTDTHMYAVPITLTKIHFKKGDILRINIQLYEKLTGAGAGCTWYLGHDPKGREGAGGIFGDTDGTSQMSFYVPFVLDL